MTSVALSTWNGRRAVNIRQLMDAHAAVTGGAPGRSWATEQLNLAMVLRLAAEFQGFCRDLHDLGSDEFARRIAPTSTPLQSIINAQLTGKRGLDVGNASPSNISQDFARLGIDMWSEVRLRSPGYSANWYDAIEALNQARNAVAHDDAAGIARVRGKGFILTQIATMKKFQSNMNKLAPVMDDVVAVHIAQLFGGGKPW